MKNLQKALKGRKAIAFLDLEGTQISHEMIELGAVLVTLDNENKIRKKKEPFRLYVKPIGPIGKIVQRLTGISEKLLVEKAVSYPEAQRLFRQYIGKYWQKALFCTFGNHDLRIIEQTTLRQKNADHDWAATICHNHFDLSSWLSQYVEDEHGNSYSLENYLKIFEIHFHGKAHDAQDDAINLMLLYQAIMDRKDILEKEYLKTLSKLHKIPEPVRKILQRIAEGETISRVDLEKEIHQYFL